MGSPATVKQDLSGLRPTADYPAARALHHHCAVQGSRLEGVRVELGWQQAADQV